MTCTCKARYAILFQIWTLPSKPEDEAHIGPTATYDEVIYPGFQHDITALHIQGYNISYSRHTSAWKQYNSGRYMSGYILQAVPSGKGKTHQTHVTRVQ